MAYIVPSVKIQDKKDMNGIIGNVNENKTKCNNILLYEKHKKRAVSSRSVGFSGFRERRSSFSLDFWPFRSSVLDGARSKVDLCGEGYAWTPSWWSSENSKR